MGGEVPGSLVGELHIRSHPGDQRVARPTHQSLLGRFAERETSGGIVLLGAAVLALAWANSPLGASYRTVWHAEVALHQGLQHWVNDALMAVFFLVVGLEIKRELVRGRLRDPRIAAMPAIAALGGMVVPAVLFLVLNRGGDGSAGWAIPTATDIAFAVGVVTVLGPRVPAPLKLFLLALAIVDDIGAIVVIGVFYPSDIRPGLLAAAAVIALAIAVLNRAGVTRLAPYLVAGAALWLVTYASGVHATIAGVALGLLIPARPAGPGSQSPGDRLDAALRHWSTFLVVPVFALANAGVVITAGAFDAPGTLGVAGGVVLGLVAGKTLGITGAAWLAVRTGLGRLPVGASWPMMVGIAAIGGVGFTVSLFIAELAFDSAALQDAAKVGVLTGSTVAAVVGGTVLRRACRRSTVADLA
jgi:Na+:H+ antiporter, NhaA family